MDDFRDELTGLIDALERRVSGMTQRQFENAVSPAIAHAFVSGWVAIGRRVEDIPEQWRDMANIYAEL